MPADTLNMVGSICYCPWENIMHISCKPHKSTHQFNSPILWAISNHTHLRIDPLITLADELYFNDANQSSFTSGVHFHLGDLPGNAEQRSHEYFQRLAVLMDNRLFQCELPPSEINDDIWRYIHIDLFSTVIYIYSICKSKRAFLNINSNTHTSSFSYEVASQDTFLWINLTLCQDFSLADNAKLQVVTLL